MSWYQDTVLRRLLLSAALPALAAGQTSSPGTMTGPTLAYLLDGTTRTIRPVSGVAGAATLDAPLPAEAGMEQAVVAAARKYALARVDGQETLQVLRWGTEATAGPLGDQALRATHWVLSPGGDAAMLFDAKSGQLQVWTGLPSAPELAWEASLPFSGEPAALAVADRGEAAAFSSAEGDQTTVRLLLPQGEPTLLPGTARVTSLAFRPGSKDLAAADAGLQQLVLWTGVESSAELRVLAGEREGVADPTALAFSADGERLIAAQSRTPGVVLLTVASGEVQLLSCSAAPTQLSRATGNATFLLTGADKPALLLLDADSNEARIVAVPTGRPAVETEEVPQ